MEPIGSREDGYRAFDRMTIRIVAVASKPAAAGYAARLGLEGHPVGAVRLFNNNLRLGVRQ